MGRGRAERTPFAERFVPAFVGGDDFIPEMPSPQAAEQRFREMAVSGHKADTHAARTDQRGGGGDGVVRKNPAGNHALQHGAGQVHLVPRKHRQTACKLIRRHLMHIINSQRDTPCVFLLLTVYHFFFGMYIEVGQN